MVFTVAEDVNRHEQTSFTKGKQRKSSSASRRVKGALSALSPRVKGQSQTLKTSPSRTELAQNEMGNVLSSQTSSNGPIPTMEHRKPKSKVDALLPQLELGTKSEDIDGHSASRQHEMQIDPPLQGVERVADGTNKEMADDSNEGGNVNTEVTRLKQLLLLQVSLISRQQDLLRLRDREIMQLKASNTNYKCQLNRVRRRMSKKKGDGVEEWPRSPKSSSKRKSSDLIAEDNLLAGKLGVSQSDKTVTDQGASLPQNITVSNDDTHKTKKRRHTASGEISVAKGATFEPFISRSGQDYVAADLADGLNMLSTPTNDRSAVPVPLSFVEQKQAELMEAMMISPPEKAIKTFCDITNSSPQLDEFPFKICNRCPHCVAIATEITRLFKTAEHSISPVPSPPKIVKAPDREILRLAAVNLPSVENKDHNKKDPTKTSGTSIMRTGVSYFRVSPTFDLNHWWWDLKCGTIKMDSSLKIPTWKEEEFSPLTGRTDQDTVECTDDQTFIKRHMKHEQDEKKRKRWDIQRIREYRYNEKLRQKLMKQGAIYEAPVIETFAGHLHDAESVEVHESLPVNVFGYPAPHVEPEEFSLAPMYGLHKNLASGGMGRRKPKKF